MSKVAAEVFNLRVLVDAANALCLQYMSWTFLNVFLVSLEDKTVNEK